MVILHSLETFSVIERKNLKSDVSPVKVNYRDDGITIYYTKMVILHLETFSVIERKNLKSDVTDFNTTGITTYYTEMVILHTPIETFLDIEEKFFLLQWRRKG